MDSHSSFDIGNRSKRSFEAQQNSLLPNASYDADSYDANSITHSADYETDRDFILENLKSSLHTLDHETARDIIQQYQSLARDDAEFQLLKRHAEKAFAKYGFKSEILLAIQATPLDSFHELEKYYTQLLLFEPDNEVWLMSLNAAKQRIIYNPETNPKTHIPAIKKAKEIRHNTCPVTAEMAARPLPDLFIQTAGRIFSLISCSLNGLLAALGIGVAENKASIPIMMLLFLATALCFAFSLPSSRLKYMELHKKSSPPPLSLFFITQLLIFSAIVVAICQFW